MTTKSSSETTSSLRAMKRTSISSNAKNVSRNNFSKPWNSKKNHNPFLNDSNAKKKIQSETKDAIHSLFEFKYLAYENTKKIRHQLDAVIKQLKDCRSKKITETLKIIKNHLIESMTEQLKMSKDIDFMMENKFLVEKEKENKELLGNLGHFVGSQFHLPVFSSDKHNSKELFFDCNRMRSRPSFVALPSHCGFWSLNDMNNLQPIFFSAPKVISEVNYGSEANYEQKSATKQLQMNQQDDQQDDDSLSMGRIGEEELKQILKGEDDKIGQEEIVHVHGLKCNGS